MDGAKGCLGSFIELKNQKPHLKVILSIGGASASQNFASVASSAAKRDNFGRSAFSIVKDAGLDGIDSKCHYEGKYTSLYILPPENI